MFYRVVISVGCVVCLPLTVGTGFLHAQSTPTGNRYALLVGVENYNKNELRNLQYSENDINALADALREGGFRQVIVMTQAAGAKDERFLPLADRIRKSVRGLLADRTEGDTILIGVAGHGVQFAGSDESYFCPMDAKLTDKSTLVSVAEFYKELEKCAAGTKILLVDACRNNPQSDFSRASAEVNLESVTRPQKRLPPGGVAAFFSCSSGEKAYESPEFKHGVFFHYVVEGLKGKADFSKDGKVDLDELVLYTKRQVLDRVKEEFGLDLRQMPELVGQSRGLLELVSLDREQRRDANRDRMRVGRDGKTLALELGDGLNIDFVRIPSGQFLMGAPESDDDRFADEEPRHRVRISKNFYMAKYAITRGQFRRFVNDTGYRTEAERDGLGGWGYDQATDQFAGPDRNKKTDKLEGLPTNYSWLDTGFDQTDDHPVVNLSWNDAVAFCEWASRKTGRRLELPTEAQWEYACRAGTESKFYNGDNPEGLVEIGNIADGTARRKFPNWPGITAEDGYVFTAPAGQFKPNAFGLYDMHGNVWQWCADWWAEDYTTCGAVDPKGVDSGKFRVLRGGSFDNLPRCCRDSYRYAHVPSFRSVGTGFRVVCTD